MTKKARDQRVENRRLSHITCDENIFDDILEGVAPEYLDSYGKPLDVEYYEYGSEKQIQLERNLRDAHFKEPIQAD